MRMGAAGPPAIRGDQVIMRIQLSDHFTMRRLLRFVVPSVIMMIFTSIYSVVDGIFVSNYAGKTQLAAINLIMPVLMMLAAIGFMVGTGGSALVAKTLGEGKKDLANRYFSMLVYVTAACGAVISVFGFIFIRNLADGLGAEGRMLEECVIYGRIAMLTLPAFMLQNVFQSFFVAAEKPKLGLLITVAAGMTNIILDAVFVAVFQWGLPGAAIATGISELVGGLVPVLYFAGKNQSLLRLGKTRFYGRILIKTCSNGISELMSNIAMSVVTIVYNFQLMRFLGEDGVAAYSVIMYVNFIFISIFLGFSMGSAPAVSYNYGAQNNDELKNLFRKSIGFVFAAGAAMVVLAEVFARPLTGLFVGYDRDLAELTLHGMRICSLSFLVCGFGIYGSAFFTALNNGKVSAVISFLRTLIFQTSAVMILPVFMGLEGVWCSVLVSETLSLAVTAGMLMKYRKKYHYA